MSFKFNFDLEDADTSALENMTLEDKPTESAESADLARSNLAACTRHSIEKLIETLPDVISYSPLDIPLASGRSLTLARRDLFDARYQLIAEADVALPTEGSTGEGDGVQSDQTRTPAFLDAPSDLVPGVYEGGLKTWECSLDLVDYLDGLKEASEGTSYGLVASSVWVGRRVLELGCGTAVPSLYLLHEIFKDERKPSDVPRTKITLQDYNASVLELITLPNVLIAWYLSPASAAYRASPDFAACQEKPEASQGKSAEAPNPALSSITEDEESAQTETDLPISPSPADAQLGNPSTTTLDATVPGDIHLTPTLKAAFLTTLAERNIELELVSGSWEGMLGKRSQAGEPGETTVDLEPYDLVLTSETIYRTASLEALIGVMRSACGAGSGSSTSSAVAPSVAAGSSSAAAASSPVAASSSSSSAPPSNIAPLSLPSSLVAAKVLYFGVGGGVPDFVRAVEEGGLGRVETVLERTKGVGRKVMRVDWQ
ncbi:hypothetical protein BD626DRAFT_27476 [Schizophyllum amplum]|uniref:protein-histidine N-methyltransferase n=1 Tax=Schizophyllum amplum TaxID=97359 RepID=A0A550CZX7_9AGAR|nr:hypothetical protein BD626DRAFT_27476 [Auriculariopsis ampla]